MKFIIICKKKSRLHGHMGEIAQRLLMNLLLFYGILNTMFPQIFSECAQEFNCAEIDCYLYANCRSQNIKLQKSEMCFLEKFKGLI